MFRSFNFLQRAVIGAVAVCLFALVLVAGAWTGLRIEKRQFETEAQNIVAVIRSGMSVVDGLTTSLEASDYSTDKLGYGQLKAHLSKVINNYDFVLSLGRFEGVYGRDLDGFKRQLSGAEIEFDGLWHYAPGGSAVALARQSDLSAHYPLSMDKMRVEVAQDSVNLTGFDLASVESTRKSIENLSSRGQTIISPIPAGWRRAGHLLVFRSSDVNDGLSDGYMLELDIEKMASSGGVSLKDFGLSLSMFSEQGEFESNRQANVLYQRHMQLGKAELFLDKIDDNVWLNSFEVGNKTLILEIQRSASLSTKLVTLSAIAASVIPLMFLCIVHLSGKRVQAQRLQKIESEKLYRARHRAAVTLGSIDDAVLTTDAEGSIRYTNEAAEKLLGHSSDEMQGAAIEKIVIFKGQGKREADVNEALKLKAADDSYLYVNRKQSVLRDSDGELTGHVLVLRDVSIERSLTLELEYKVNHDSLTGLSNRLNFEHQLNTLFDNPDSNAPGYGLCFIDLDRFKEVNDTCGHDAGDELLKRIAEAFKSNVRENDLVARLGGDEFGVVLNSCTREEAVMVAERIKEFFQSFYFNYDEHVFPVRCSIGIVHFQPASNLIEDVLKSADAACFDAKNGGRNSVCERVVGDSTKLSDNGSQWLSVIKNALEHERFVLHVQSIASLGDGSVSAHEILVRIVDEDGSLINPSAFMKSAVRYELASDIDHWVIQKALSEIASLPSDFSDDRFFVNLSAQTIGSAEFIEFFQRQASLTGVDPRRIGFDFREQDVLNNPSTASDFFKQLRLMGCEVALDDFGASMTSFTTLKTLAITILKLDQSLIATLGALDPVDDEHNIDLALVRSIHGFASNMGLTTIAEQVEEQGCLEALKLLQLDYVQGKVIHGPVPIEYLVSGNDGAAQHAA